MVKVLVVHKGHNISLATQLVLFGSRSVRLSLSLAGRFCYIKKKMEATRVSSWLEDFWFTVAVNEFLDNFCQMRSQSSGSLLRKSPGLFVSSSSSHAFFCTSSNNFILRTSCIASSTQWFFFLFFLVLWFHVFSFKRRKGFLVYLHISFAQSFISQCNRVFIVQDEKPSLEFLLQRMQYLLT